MIVNDAVVEAACRAFYDAGGVHWDTLSPHDQRLARQCLGTALEAVLPQVVAQELRDAAVDIDKRWRPNWQCCATCRGRIETLGDLRDRATRLEGGEQRG